MRGSSETEIPRILDATAAALPFRSDDDGWLLRDLDLAALLRIAESRHPWLAVDLDTVEGLNSDSAAVRFAVERLRANAVVSRRPGVATLAAELGVIGLVRIFAFDSTGLRRSLEPIESHPRVGTVVSPGIVLPYIEPGHVGVLPKPLVAYGLVERVEQVLRLLEIADTVVVRPDLAPAARAAQQRRMAADTHESGATDALDISVGSA